MKKKIKNILAIILIVLVIIVVAFSIYVRDIYDASELAYDSLTTSEEVKLIENEGIIHFKPIQDSVTGIIFYPGGKVDEVAYAPLTKELAQEGYETFIVEMPFNLAVFDIDAADSIVEENPHIDSWYLAGHSLGGAMAAIYAEDKVEELDGLILLAAYSTADFSQTDLPVFILSASEDQVMNQEQVEEYRANLPDNAILEEIQGGNHAQFGRYGEQEGDGKAQISARDQQKVTVEAINHFIKNNQ